MATIRKNSQEIREFILAQTEKHPLDLAKIAAEAFGISRQAVNRHIRQLIDENLLELAGTARKPHYKLKSSLLLHRCYGLDGTLEEDRVWRSDIAPLMRDLPKNALDIWHYGFTEMLNNAIDHSGGDSVQVSVKRAGNNHQITIADDGEGIFKKIQNALNLCDESHAVLELAKGKLTTDPARHTGEGIFFASRVFDDFSIHSGNVVFSHSFGEETDWIMEPFDASSSTAVFMRLDANASQTLKSVFDQFASGEDFAFSKTVVPVRLAQYGDESPISRSQARRVLNRIERFETVIFDFVGVNGIGQAFADEIFRVYALAHPHMELIPVHANGDVQAMISRALSAR